jgi:hypothetical protein
MFMFRTLRMDDATNRHADGARTRGRGACALVLGLALCGAMPAAASAAPAIALTTDNALVKFDTAAPGATTTTFVTGLAMGETLTGIDARPANGLLYGVAVSAGPAIRVYRIDPVTGAATAAGPAVTTLPGAGNVDTALDFNPVVDRIRYVNVNDENARFNPDSGALAGDDTNINPVAADIVGAAYDRNVSGTTLTTLYAINRATGQLALIGGVDGAPSPNTGTVTDIGSLGVGTLLASVDAGFDIAPDGTAFAVLTPTTTNTTALYTINLTTGAATLVGTLGTGASEILSLAILTPFASCNAALQAHGCWGFNEPPTSTTALDSSPFLNNGTYLGNPVLGTSGVRNTAVTMDGINDTVRVPDSASLDTGDSFSLEGWIRRGPTTKSHELFNKGGNGYQLVVMGSPNGNQVFLRKAGVTTIVRSATGVPVDSAYHHIVATKNGPNTAQIYIDGVEGTVNVSGVQIVQDTSFLLTFGAAGSTPADYDEFAVYDRALTPGEVLGRFAGGPAPVPF